MTTKVNNEFCLTEEEKAKKKLAKEYCEIIESKLRKSEHSIWMIKDHDHLEK